jgi:hypothetical protein
LTFVNYVRDRKDAQVHILTTIEYTGAGGQKQTFFFIGQQEYFGQTDTLSFFLKADATADETRTKQVNLLKLGLVRYVAKTPYAEKLSINFVKGDEDELVTDKWNSWVFEVNGSTYFEGQKSYSDFNTWLSTSAQRVTDKIKLEFEVEYGFTKEKFVVDDSTILSVKNEKDFDHLLVKSINDHWSYGYKMEIESSLFENYDLYAKLYPAIEYNLFPYSKSNRKQLRFLYSLGIKHFNYIDSTYYDKTVETLFGQSLGIATQFKEKWGSVNVSLEGSHFFHDMSLNKIELYTNISLRLFKGLSLRIQGSVSLIHDQINLPKGEITSEDILLHRIELESQYAYWGYIGLSYSFGSIYNNVVNPRFGD